MGASRRNGRHPTVRNLIPIVRITPMGHVHGTATTSIPHPPQFGHVGRLLLRQASSPGISAPQRMTPFLKEGSPAEGRLTQAFSSHIISYVTKAASHEVAPHANQKGWSYESEDTSNRSDHWGDDGNTGDGVDRPCQLQFGRIDIQHPCPRR